MNGNCHDILARQFWPKRSVHAFNDCEPSVIRGTSWNFSVPTFAQGTKTVQDGANNCKVTIPADWVAGTMNWHSPADARVTVEVRGLLASGYQGDVDTYKSMHATTVDDNAKRILLSVPVFGGHTQLTAITKTAPMGCRATVTFSDASKQAAARTIVESVALAK